MIEPKLQIVAVGDLSFNGGYDRRLQVQGPAYPFLAMRDEWGSAAIRLGNLESPIARHGRVSPTKLTLRGSGLTAEALLSAGFDCVSLANNHMMDFGPRGLLETCERLDAAGISHVGAGRSLEEAMAPTILKRQGYSIGVLAFCDVEQDSPLYATTTSAGVAPAQLNVCREAIASLRNRVDWIVVHMHWGIEMSRLPSPMQRCWAQGLISSGANLIVGHHPHVIQPVEIIGSGVAAYSLGDFTFSNTFWHGVNGGGLPFLGHYEVHPLSRRTGWLQAEFSPGQSPAVTWRPACLKPNLAVMPQDTPTRQREWRRLNQLLEHPDYQQVFEAESSQALQRGNWRMSSRRLLPRLKLKLLKYGCIPGATVEPDGASWRAGYRLSPYGNRAQSPA